jgi:hypothetical protein
MREPYDGAAPVDRLSRSFEPLWKWPVQGVYVVVRFGDSGGKPRTSRGSEPHMIRSQKLQRVTAMSVSALLAANALVLVVGLGDDLASSTPDEPETVTFIVDDAGQPIAVDPATPEGVRAIADAQDRGQEVVTVPADEAPTAVKPKPTTTTTRPKPRPATSPGGSGVTIPDVEQVLDDTLTTVVETVETVGETVDQTVDGVTDVVDGTTGLDSGETVDPIVDDVTDTLTTTVSTLVESITDITLPPVTVPPVTVPGL